MEPVMSPGPSSLAVAILALSNEPGRYPAEKAAQDVSLAIAYLEGLGLSLKEKSQEVEHMRQTCVEVLEMALRQLRSRG